jgi:hypothetical protein
LGLGANHLANVDTKQPHTIGQQAVVVHGAAAEIVAVLLRLGIGDLRQQQAELFR